MLALRKRLPAPGAELVECDRIEALSTGEIAVKVHAAGICGSDLHAHAWEPAYGFMESFLPLTLGHEFTGIVTGLGAGVSQIAIGDAVVCCPTVACGKCKSCRNSLPGSCETRRVIGLHRDGGFAEEVRIPAKNALLLPNALPLDVAALTEPLAVSINAVNVGEVLSGDRVLVLGPGPIGMGVAIVAKARGAKVMLAGYDDDARLELARAMGIEACVDLKHVNLADAVTSHFEGGLDIIFEATGRAESVASGLTQLRSGGVLVVVGIHAEPLTLDLNVLVRGKKQLRGSHDATPEAFAEAVERLAAEPELYTRMITHRLPLADAEEGFALARKRAALKVMLFPEGNPNV